MKILLKTYKSLWEEKHSQNGKEISDLQFPATGYQSILHNRGGIEEVFLRLPNKFSRRMRDEIKKSENTFLKTLSCPSANSINNNKLHPYTDTASDTDNLILVQSLSHRPDSDPEKIDPDVMFNLIHRNPYDKIYIVVSVHRIGRVQIYWNGFRQPNTAQKGMPKFFSREYFIAINMPREESFFSKLKNELANPMTWYIHNGTSWDNGLHLQINCQYTEILVHQDEVRFLCWKSEKKLKRTGISLLQVWSFNILEFAIVYFEIYASTNFVRLQDTCGNCG